MSTKPLIGHRHYLGHEQVAESTRCSKPWGNLVVALLSIIVLGAFVVWTISDGNHNSQNKRLLSEFSRTELLTVLTDDNGYTDSAMEDLVTDLPYLQGSYDFLQFSGYLEANDNRLIHYWFVEAQTDPDNAPLFLWTNGGPGCSGLLGFLSEHGPFWVYPDYSLRENEYSWNKLVNMLYVEQPYGVGFSQPTGDNECVRGDTEATADMDALLRSFMKQFPKFADNELYISSESYGGHYMPRLALTILENNEDYDEEDKLNFKGFLLGNPYTDGYENSMGYMAAIYGHGVIKSDNYELWMNNCWDNTEALDSLYCDELYIISYIQAYSLDAYALDYSICPMDTISGGSGSGSGSDTGYSGKGFGGYAEKIGSFMREEGIGLDDVIDDDYKSKSRLTQSYLLHHVAKKKIQRLLGEDNLESKLQMLSKADLLTHDATIPSHYESDEGAPWIPCADYYIERYLNFNNVKEALHVDTSIGWAECSDAVFYGWPESDWANGMEKTYHTLVDNYDIKIMIFSGDDDSVCAIQGTMYWMTRMGWDVDENNDWEAWTVSNQLAGFYRKYLKSDGSTAVHFQSIRSAGHMVPQTQPLRALQLLYKYLYEI